MGIREVDEDSLVEQLRLSVVAEICVASGQALGLSGNKRPIGGNICLDGLAKDSVIAAVVSTEDSSLQINVFVIDSEIHFHGAQTGKANAVLVVN